MDSTYYRNLWKETNRKRKAAGRKPFTWKDYQERINVILERQRQDLQNYDETGDREAEEME